MEHESTPIPISTPTPSGNHFPPQGIPGGGGVSLIAKRLDGEFVVVFLGSWQDLYV